MKAVILAGGKGTRLAPYTTILPKPLMPVGDMPILEIVIRRLVYYGFDNITLAVGHLSELIEAFFGDGSRFGAKLVYSREDAPLSTAGPISIIADLTETFLVMNGDLLTDIDFDKMLEFHRSKGAKATMAVYEKTIDIDLGVIEIDGKFSVGNYIEKPQYKYLVSTGIYLFEPSVLKYLPYGKKKDLPELVMEMLRNKENVLAFPFSGYWLDIGRHDDYKVANIEFQARPELFLPKTSS